MTGYIHNKSVCKDIQVDDLNDKLFNILDRTITSYGKIKLRNRLRYYQYDTQKMERQSLQNFTVHQDSLYLQEMEKSLNKIARLEKNIDKWMLKNCNDELIFKRNIFNNRVFLSVSNKVKISSMIIAFVIYILLYLFIWYQGLKLTPYGYVKRIIQGYYYGIKYACVLLLSKNKNWINVFEWIALILTSSYVAYQLYMTYQTVNTCYEHYKKCNLFYADYNQLCEYIGIVEKMIENETYINTDTVKKSVNELKKYFAENTSLGYSLVTKIDTTKYIKHVDVITNYVGRVDTQLCITKLMDEGYTIPKFVDAQFPIIHCEDVWNPMLKNSVKNSLIMDVTTPNVMIITGPNKAGKSTFMKSIITCIYLSQSLGISCCKRMSLTPFKKLSTYLNIPDSIGKESLFEAEINRCYDYIEKAESLDGFSFGILDELFTGTNPKEGMASSYAILNRLTNIPINITIISTHFHDMVGKLNNQNFLNTYFSAKYDMSGKFIFDYKINNGVSDQCIALKLLEDKGFDKDIINDAKKYIESFKNVKSSKT